MGGVYRPPTNSPLVSTSLEPLAGCFTDAEGYLCLMGIMLPRRPRLQGEVNVCGSFILVLYTPRRRRGEFMGDSHDSHHSIKPFSRKESGLRFTPSIKRFCFTAL